MEEQHLSIRIDSSGNFLLDLIIPLVCINQKCNFLTFIP